MATPITPKVAIIYYSSTGSVHALTQEYAKGLENEGAEVRIRKVHELAPADAIAGNEAWAKHLEATADVPEATADDVLWADAVVFGTPTRYGNVTAQLKQFIDMLGPQWSQGLLADKVYSGFTSTSTRPRRPGVDPARALQHHPPLRRHPRDAGLHRADPVHDRQPVRPVPRRRRRLGGDLGRHPRGHALRRYPGRHGHPAARRGPRRGPDRYPAVR